MGETQNLQLWNKNNIIEHPLRVVTSHKEYAQEEAGHFNLILF